MKVFMVGWEYPPYISGGLGTACYGLTTAMAKQGHQVIMVVPKGSGHPDSPVKVISPVSEIYRQGRSVKNDTKGVSIWSVDVALEPYSRPQQYLFQSPRNREDFGEFVVGQDGLFHISGEYAGDMYAQIGKYAKATANIATSQDFDIIHAHDWMTYPAAVMSARATRKPLVIHVHSTEFDRSGENVNQCIYDIERMGTHLADKVIAVSAFTKNILIEHYSLAPEKIHVVHNGVAQKTFKPQSQQKPDLRKDEKTVLFLGRVTMQKGPEYFLYAAKKVLEVCKNIRFIISGSGDMLRRMIELSADLRIGRFVSFTGFLNGPMVDRAYQMADLYVMPSVSEPFGIAPLEALTNNVPVLISKQSGVAEVLPHALKVDFWDIDEMANKIAAVLKFPPLQDVLRLQGTSEVSRINWHDSAANCINVYQKVLAAA